MIPYIPLLILAASAVLFGFGVFAITKSGSQKSVKMRWQTILGILFAIVAVLTIGSLKPKERIIVQILATGFLLVATTWKSFAVWRSLKRHREQYLRLSVGMISICLVLLIGLFLKDVLEVLPLLKHAWPRLTWNTLGLRVGAPLLPAAILAIALEKIKQKALKRAKQ